MNKFLFKSLAGLSIGLLAMGCSSTAVITAPPISYTNTSPRISALSDSESMRWGHKDFKKNSIESKISVNQDIDALLKKEKANMKFSKKSI